MAKFLYILILLIVCDIIRATDPSMSSTAAATDPLTSSIAADPSTSNISDEASKPDTELPMLSTVQYEVREEEETELGPQCLEVIYEEDEETKFYRDCYYADEEIEKYPAEVCSEEIGSSGTVKKCNLCTNDLCNASGKAATSILSIIAGLISTFFYFNNQARFLI